MKYLWNYLDSQSWCGIVAIVIGAAAMIYAILKLIEYNAKRMRRKNGE